jgi:hypothetical protein
MPTYHINAAGNPGRCTASAGHCPFGSPTVHYADPVQARSAYERRFVSARPVPLTKRVTRIEQLDEQLLQQALKVARAETPEEKRAIEAETAPIAIIRAELLESPAAFNEPPD